MSPPLRPSWIALLALALAGCLALPDDLPDAGFGDGGGPDAGGDPVVDAAPHAAPDGAAPDAEPMSSPEVCNGRDDDLDDSVDEGVRNACGACGAVPEEACDGFDNDCDLIVDEAASCVCAPGAEEVCGADVGRCVAGARVCGAEGSWGACSATGPEAEVCNGLDDDCDGQADERVQNRCGACGPLEADVCNGADDDCDGVIDGADRPGEACPCPLGERRACGSDEGRCSRGTQTCSPGGWGPCEGGQGPTAEACDRVDDDCDGAVDEGACDCPLDEVRACGSDVGLCRMGRQVCAVDGWGPCQGAIDPVAERCNGSDDDCDGASDEGWLDLGQGCSDGVGQCRVEGVRVCSADGLETRCSAVAAEMGMGEICNGLDDDCDRRVDEVIFVDGCATGEPGLCSSGARVCIDGAVSCRRSRDPQPERCDGQDLDCDGTVDEGFRAVGRQVAYATLGGVHPQCDGDEQLAGPDCNAAIHRWCRDSAEPDCLVSGFGPVEQSNGNASVACVSVADVRPAPFVELSQHVQLCSADGIRYGAPCAAAIHLWCRERGFVSGFGPVESQPDRLFAACVGQAATPVPTTYDALSAQHPGCRGVADREGTDCKAAIRRLCSERGFVSGYGPVTMTRPGITVVCIAR